MIKIPRFEYYHRKLFFNFNRKNYTNPRVSDNFRKHTVYGCEFNFIAFGLDDRMFSWMNDYYDGHTVKGLTFFYITLYYGYSYGWEIKDD